MGTSTSRNAGTAEAIDADGWFHSGDVGVLDQDGYLSIVDRSKDMLLYKGYNVFPRELEQILFSVPGVAGPRWSDAPTRERENCRSRTSSVPATTPARRSRPTR